METNLEPLSGQAVDVPVGARDPWKGWVWAAPALAILVLVGVLVASHGGGFAGTARWPEQQAAFLALNAAFAALPAALWYGITLLGDTSVLMLLLALFVPGRPQVWAAALAAVPAGALFSTLTKHWANVPRPAAVLDPSLFNVIGPALHSNSFPSGHTITAFAAAAAVLATLSPSPRRGRDWLLVVAGLLVAVTVAFSRVAVGAHWPLDLAAGASGGWLAGLSGAALARRMGWWQWLVVGAGRRAAGAGLILWGLLLWFRPHDTPSSAVVLGVSGLCGVGTGLWLLLRRSAVSESPMALAASTSASEAAQPGTTTGARRE